MESTCSTKSARWSQHWVHSKCNQPVIGLCIMITLGQSFKMGAICNWWTHFGHSGNKHSECAQFLTITHIVDPLWRTFKMYPIFNCWVHCGQVLSVPTMYSPCTHWVYRSLSPVRGGFGNEQSSSTRECFVASGPGSRGSWFCSLRCKCQPTLCPT